MSVSCGVCADVIVGLPYREPLGRNDALIPVCKRCATEEVGPPSTQPRRTVTNRVLDPRALRIKANRDLLASEGLCIYGRAHGAATVGKLCQLCADLRSANERRRREGKQRRAS